MLCRIRMMDNILDSTKSVEWIINVPDGLYMQHMAMYDKFMLSAVSDADMARCVFLGKSSDYVVAPYTPPKEKK